MRATIPDWPAVKSLGKTTEYGEVRAVSVVPLGNNADFVSTVGSQELTNPVFEVEKTIDIHAVLPPPATVKAFYLRSLGREIMKKSGVDRRMRWCGSRISQKKDGVNVYARPDRAYGRVGGVCVCGQSICCPVCAPRIAAFRSAEIAKAFERARDAGWECSMETFTKPHHLSFAPDALKKEFTEFSDIWRSFMVGRRGHKREKESEGSHVGREINWGSAHGWHYHHHRLRYDRPGVYDSQIARADGLAAREAFGLRTEGTETFAYDCGAVGDEAGARYIAKVSTSVEAQGRAIGSELASSATKGRNINSLLADYARGDQQAGAIWLNGVSCVTAGKVSSVRWSRGLRLKLGLGKEKSDDEIAAEEKTATDVFLGSLNPLQWSGVLKHRAEFALLCAANQGEHAINSFLTGLSLGKLNDEPPGPVLTPDSGEYKRKRHHVSL